MTTRHGLMAIAGSPDVSGDGDFKSFFDSFDLKLFDRCSDIKTEENILLHRDLFHCEENIYYILYKKHPSTFDIKIKKEYLKKLVESIRQQGLTMLSCSSDVRHKLTENIYFVNREKNLLIRIYITSEREYEADAEKLFTVSVFFDIADTPTYEIVKKLKDDFAHIPDNNHNIYMLQKDAYGEMSLQPHSIKGFELDIKENYDDSFEEVHNKILEWAKDFDLPNNRITLLHGDPGAGKTNYIKHIMNELPSVRKIYIPPFYVSALSDPAFLGFIRDYSNSLLIIEDAENILVSREQDSENSAMSIILNLSDGIMGSVLNFKIIATFNTEEKNIDSALKRRGRMFIKHHFGKLSEAKTKALYQKLYGKNPPETQMVLADIYNSEDNGNNGKKEKRVMGFIH